MSASRYDVSASDSSLSFEARSTLHAMRGKAEQLSGFIEAGWSADGALETEPAPKMHVEFPVNRLASGNAMQDREMHKLVDGARFPRVAADLRALHPAAHPGRYKAGGEITLAGRSRVYDGEFVIVHADERVSLEGELHLDIRDFGLKPPSLLMFKVEPVVKVRLRLIAKKRA